MLLNLELFLLIVSWPIAFGFDQNTNRALNNYVKSVAVIALFKDNFPLGYELKLEFLSYGFKIFALSIVILFEKLNILNHGDQKSVNVFICPLFLRLLQGYDQVL